MTLNEYQALAKRTAAGSESIQHEALLIRALGLCGESGEVAELVKKHVGHGHALDRQKVVKELGDVLWYVAMLADAIGATFAEVGEHNIAKLRARYPQGFSSAASIGRSE
jgi:NTP pyrophosphatase (non-canonical NTP hydrolase)